MRRLSGIPASPVLAVMAVAGSLAVHLGVLGWVETPQTPDVQATGGGGAVMAVQGTSFADLAAGISQSVPVEVTSAIEPPAPILSEAAVGVTPAATQPAVPVATSPAISAAQTPEISAAVQVLPNATRPRARPKVDQQPAKEKAKQKPVPRGTAQEKTTRGRTGGATAGPAVTSGSGQQQAAGNAAVSNYPAEVQRRIARQRLPRVNARGVARVSFTISGAGGLAALGIAQSSGSAELDREALTVIRRAAPFPAPPAGAQRSFTIAIRAR